ncbi:MAG: MBOAT family O-acyltransferase [Sporomusaceae bacterium]|nr:MBOAT family O-acyltransferase [Sporomusaceae bacterium]
MLFNSYPFIFVFLPVTLLCYFYLNRRHLTLAAKGWLAAASLFFYGWFNLQYIPILLGSIFFNFFLGKRLIATRQERKSQGRKRLLQFALAVNISVLVYFKYTDFFLENINLLFGSDWPLWNLVLPLGISFFTITQLTYLVDSYEGLVKKSDFLDYFLFVTFFPHLLMGPILHHKQMMPQFDRLRSKLFQADWFMSGIALFTLGLAKKVLLADAFARIANPGFVAPEMLSSGAAWVVSFAYTFQLYFDFSGYSDMALGIGRMFNIRLPINFNSPYKAKTIIEFWQRWHISLTQFITTYLYTPIFRAFGKFTFPYAMAATFLAMMIAGLWHQAGWGFLLFYALHATGLVVNHWWRRQGWKVPAALAWAATFLFVNGTLVILRSPDLTTAFTFFRAMLGRSGGTTPEYLTMEVAILFGVGAALAFCGKNSQDTADSLSPSWTSALLLALLLLAALLNLNQVSEFLYFKF